MPKITLTRYVASDGTEHESKAEEQRHELVLQVASVIRQTSMDNDERFSDDVCRHAAERLMQVYKIKPHVERKPRKPRGENIDQAAVEDTSETEDLAFEEDEHISQ